MAALLSYDNPVFRAYALSAGVVVAKTFAMNVLIGLRRNRANAYANPEDAMFATGAEKDKVKPRVNEAVERARRNHLNDIENIPIFLALGLLYVLTQPSPQVALWHFRVFAGSRILHTVAYQNGLQPWRALTFMAGLLSCLSMVTQVIMKAW